MGKPNQDTFTKAMNYISILDDMRDILQDYVNTKIENESLRKELNAKNGTLDSVYKANQNAIAGWLRFCIEKEPESQE